MVKQVKMQSNNLDMNPCIAEEYSSQNSSKNYLKYSDSIIALLYKKFKNIAINLFIKIVNFL